MTIQSVMELLTIITPAWIISEIENKYTMSTKSKPGVFAIAVKIVHKFPLIW